MFCNCDTSTSEFLAGISVLSVGIHLGIVFLLRPRMVQVVFDPIRLGRGPYVASASRDKKYDSDEEKDSDSPTEESENDAKESEETDGTDDTSPKKGLYSYFT